jgi:glycosyltransferase involved in cell wall biosynthesis
MARISIALATFNGESFLRQQLASLANQDVLPYELVVADDGSSDDTVSIIEAFAASAPFPVRTFRNEVRLGYRVNFVNIVGICKGDLIAFCDQDDIWSTGKLRLMQEPFEDPNVLLAYHNSRLVDETGLAFGTVLRRRNRRHTFAPLATRPWQIIPGHSQVVRRSLKRFNELHSESIDPFVKGSLAPHDYWYQFWASVLGKIVYLPDLLVDYRQHQNNASGWQYRFWTDYLIDHVVNAESLVLSDITGATNRLHLLKRSQELLEGVGLDRIDAAERAYETLLQQSTDRLEIYRRGNMRDRAHALGALLQKRTYSGSGHQGLGLDTLFLDAFAGVLLPSLPRLRLLRRNEDL